MAIRIGNGCGFWGDSPDAPIELAREGKLDYLTLEYLAELTMSILAGMKRKDPETGFATDFIDVLTRLASILQAQSKLKIVTNAGGMNPHACAKQAKAALVKAGLSRKIGVVSGDDLFPRLDELLADGQEFRNLDTGETLAGIRDKVVSANAYLGAEPIAAALKAGAEIVVTGRVADASLTVGPCIAEFGWKDIDRLSTATVAGHLIECGAQVTGGIATNWQKAEPLDRIGYPIAELDADGTMRITKVPGTGGMVNFETVSEQLLYEVGDPAAYLTPDVVSDFTTVAIKELGKDLVEVRGAKGKPATDFYKVSIAYRNGFMSSGTLVLAGPEAVAKADRAGDIILQKLEHAGFHYQRTNVEVIGNPDDAYLRVTVHDPNRSAVDRFTREFAPLACSGPIGVTGYATGRAAVREVFAYWPALVSKSAVQGKWEILE